MKMNEMFYVAPEVEIVEVAVERGFFQSGPSADLGDNGSASDIFGGSEEE